MILSIIYYFIDIFMIYCHICYVYFHISDKQSENKKAKTSVLAFFPYIYYYIYQEVFLLSLV